MSVARIPDEITSAPAIKSGEVLSYVDEPSRRYVDGLKLILKADELRGYLARWPFLAADAIKQAKKLTDADVQYMQRYSNDESKGEEVARRFGCVLGARWSWSAICADGHIYGGFSGGANECPQCGEPPVREIQDEGLSREEIRVLLTGPDLCPTCHRPYAATRGEEGK